jgi:hypothetical protein
MISGQSNGNILIFDPRTSKNHSLSIESGHHYIKGLKVSATTEEYLLMSSGFDSAGDREIRRFDTRYPKSHCGLLKIMESHASILNPFVDPSLSVAYFASKNEGIRIIDYLSKTDEIILVGAPAMPKKFTGIDILPKNILDISKAEVARFVTLNSDKTIESVSLCVPRRKDKIGGTFNDDIFPPIEIIEKNTIEQWFQPPAEQRKLSIIRKTTVNRRELNVSGLSQISYSGGRLSSTNSSIRRNVTSSTNNSAVKELKQEVYGCLLESAAERLVRGWVSDQTVPCFLALYPDYLLLTDAFMAVWKPIKIKEITKIEINAKEPDVLFFIYHGDKYFFRFLVWDECQFWNEKISFLNSSEFSTPFSGHVLLNSVQFSNVSNSNKTEMCNRLLVATETKLVLVFSSMEKYLKKQLPLEAIQVESAIAIRQQKHGFTLVTGNRSYHIKCDNSVQEWVQYFFDNNPALTTYFYGEGELGINNNTVWALIHRSQIHYYNGRWDAIPERIVRTDDLKIKHVIEGEQGELKTLTLNLEREDICHQFDDEAAFLKWKFLFSEFCRLQTDLLKNFGLDSTKSISKLLKEHEAIKNSCGVVFIDSKSRQEMSSSIMLRVSHQSGLHVDTVPRCNALLVNDCCYVIETGDSVLIWRGQDTSRILFADANHIQQEIRKAKGNRLKLIIPDDEEYQKALKVAFLGDKLDHDDFPTEIIQKSELHLFDSTDLKLDLIFEGFHPSKELLKNCIILITSHEVFWWCSATSSIESRQYSKLVSYEMARKLRLKIKKTVYHYEEHEGTESVLFKRKFKDFPTELPIGTRQVTAKSNIAKEEIQMELSFENAPILIEDASECENYPRGGKFVQSIIEGFEKVKLAENEKGVYLRSKSYVLSYEYMVGGKSKCVLFFWQGYLSKIIEKGTSAMIAVETSKQIGGDVSQIRVVDGKEPPVFNQIMNSPVFIVRYSTKGLDVQEWIIFDVRENNGLLKAYEVKEDTNYEPTPKNCMVILSKTRSVIALSEFSTILEKEACLMLVEKFGLVKSHNKIGFEELAQVLPLAFPLLKHIQVLRDYLPECKLYRTSSVTGPVKLEQLLNFTQADLISSSVFILDRLEEIQIWIGERSKWIEQKMAVELSKV